MKPAKSDVNTKINFYDLIMLSFLHLNNGCVFILYMKEIDWLSPYGNHLRLINSVMKVGAIKGAASVLKITQFTVSHSLYRQYHHQASSQLNPVV